MLTGDRVQRLAHGVVPRGLQHGVVRRLRDAKHQMRG